MRYVIDFYEDAEGRIRWRLSAANGHILADGGQGYSRITDARNGMTSATGFEVFGEDQATARRALAVDNATAFEFATVKDLRKERVDG